MFDQHLQSAEDLDGVVRDLLVGSLLDSKANERYYFRHRSYLEFLVAKHIVNMEWTSATAELVAKVLTPEIVAFLGECPAESDMTFRRWLYDAEADLSTLFLDVIALADRSALREPALTFEAHERDVYLFWRALRLRGEGDVEIVRRLLMERARLKHGDSARACLIAALIQAVPGLAESPAVSEASRVLLTHIFAVLFVDAESEMQRLSSADRFMTRIHSAHPSLRMLIPAFRREDGVEGSGSVRMDVTSLIEAADQAIQDSQMMNEIVGVPASYTIDLEEIAEVAAAQLGNQSMAATAGQFVEKFEMALLQTQLHGATVRLGRTRKRR